MKGKILVVIASILLITFIGVGITKVKSGEQLKEFQKIQLQNRDNELKLEQIETQKLKNRLNDGEKKSQEELQKLRQEIDERKQNEERLERELQAKLQRQNDEESRLARLAEKAVNTATQTKTASAASYGGNKQSWLEASGIPSSEWWAVDSIVSRESSWNPNAVNASSGACGLGQQLPCGKWAGAWNDPVAALKAQYQYVKDRYGGYPQAVSFWNANKWY